MSLISGDSSLSGGISQWVFVILFVVDGFNDRDLGPDGAAQLLDVQPRLADGFRRWGVQLVRYGHVP